MADVFSDGSTWLAGQLKSHASQDCTYHRGTLGVAIKATRGRTETDAWTADVQDGVVNTRADDFIVAPGDLVLGGETITPRKDDRIVCPQGTFRVMPLEGERCYRNSGAYNTLIRIHTKRISD